MKGTKPGPPIFCHPNHSRSSISELGALDPVLAANWPSWLTCLRWRKAPLNPEERDRSLLERGWSWLTNKREGFLATLGYVDIYSPVD